MAPVTNLTNVNVTEIASFEDILIAGQRFFELREGTRYLADLTDYPFAALCSQEDGANFYDKLFAMQGVNVVPTFKVDTASLLLPLVRRGMCLAFIPAPFLPQISSSGDLFQVRIQDEMPSQTICLATAGREDVPQVLKDLIDLIRHYASIPAAFDALPD